jgi:signal transduction histidine kinase
MPPSVRHVRRDLALWMVALRRITLVAGVGALLAQKVAFPGGADPLRIALVAAGIALHNELGRVLLTRLRDRYLGQVVNAQVALDVIALSMLLHFGGGLTGFGILFFAPAFFVYGVVLPPRYAYFHVVLVMMLLAGLGEAEASGLFPHAGSVFSVVGPYTGQSVVLLTVMYVSIVNALCAYVSHYLSQLLSKQEEQSRRLASERGELLAQNEREAARVRALLDVAQHVSAIHAVDELLRAVCDTTVALVRVPRVDIFLWDGERNSLRLAAGRAGGEAITSGKDVRYPAELPIVARLRAGEVVQFGAGPSHTLVPGRVTSPLRKGFAAPMLCQDSFEGALFVAYEGESTEELTALVQGIARQAALALANVRAMEQQKEDAEVSRVLLQISQGLSACLDEEALWTLLARGASEVLDLPWSVATRFDERSGGFKFAGGHGLPPDRLKAMSRGQIRLEDSAKMQEALSSRQLVVAQNEPVRPFCVPGNLKPGSWIAIPLVRGGWVAGFLTAGAFETVPHFTRRQLRLAEGIGHHAAIALQNARLVADIEAADRLKSEFVSTMSHELRTPLNVIIGYTEMLREEAVGPVNEGQRDLIDRLDARGRELLELIEATLHVGRLEAGRDTLELAPLEFSELAQALQACTAGLPRPPAVAFEWDLSVGPGQPIVTDRAKLALVVRNLVSNALKFTSEGKVLVRIGAQEQALVIEVEDTGIGISEEHLPLIFEMFRQVDGSMTRRHGGVGLGLYIVKQFVTRLGGTVSVTSTPGRGSLFRVVVPGAIRPAAEGETREPNAA